MRKVPQREYLQMFKEITEQMYETTKRKNSDYTGDDGDAFKNFTMVDVMTGGHITVDQGFFGRMTDKMMRFAGFIRNGTLQVADEKIEDTVLDLAVYCILYVCYRRSRASLVDNDNGNDIGNDIVAAFSGSTLPDWLKKTHDVKNGVGPENGSVKMQNPYL